MSKPAFMGHYRSPSLEPFYTDERCFITELMNSDKLGHLSVCSCRVAAGVTTRLHKLDAHEHYIVQQGTGLMEIGQTERFEIGVGDCAVIPAGVAQRVRNTGNEDLIFLAVCTPRFKPEHYTDMESGSVPVADLV